MTLAEKKSENILKCVNEDDVKNCFDIQYRSLVKDIEILKEYLQIISENNPLYAFIIFCELFKYGALENPEIRLAVADVFDDITANIHDLLHRIASRFFVCLILDKDCETTTLISDSTEFLHICSNYIFYFQEDYRYNLAIKLLKKIEPCKDISNKALGIFKNRPITTRYGMPSTMVLDYVRGLIDNKRFSDVVDALSLFPEINEENIGINSGDFISNLPVINDGSRDKIDMVKLIPFVESVISLRRCTWDLVLIDELHEKIKKAICARHLWDEVVKSYLSTFFICFKITIDSHYEEKIVINSALVQPDLLFALRHPQKDALISIIRDNPNRIMSFIDELSGANYYRFHKDNCMADISVNVSNEDEALYWLKQSATHILPGNISSDDDMKVFLSLYLNSFFRISVPFNEFFAILYSKSSPKERRSDSMMAKKIFSDYKNKFVGILRMVNGFPQIYSREFMTRKDRLVIHEYEELNMTSLTSFYNQKKQADPDGVVYIHYDIHAYNIIHDFAPEICVDSNDYIGAGVCPPEKICDHYCELLDGIITSKTFDDSARAIVDKLPNWQLKKHEYDIAGAKIVEVCLSLSSNAERVEFLKLLGQHNVYSYSLLNNVLSTPITDEGVIDKSHLLMDIVCEEEGSSADKLYIYLNTMIRKDNTFEAFVNRVYDVSGDSVNLADDFITSGCNLYGKTVYINEGRVCLRVRSCRSVPKDNEGFCNYFATNTYGRLSRDDYYNFIVDSYSPSAKVFTVKNLERRQEEERTFYEIMNKASKITVLKPFDIRHFNIKPAGLTELEWKNLAIYEILAIRARMNDDGALKSFMKTIKGANPWSDIKCELPCVVLENEVNDFDIAQSAIIDLIKGFDIEKVLEIYFTTSFRSAFSLAWFLSRLVKEYGDFKEFAGYLEKYPVVITKNKANVFLEKSDCFIEDGSYSICGFKSNKQQIILKDR